MIQLAAYGARLLVHDDADLNLASILVLRFPPDIVSSAADETAAMRYDVTRDEDLRQYSVRRSGETIGRSDTAAGVIEHLCARLELDLATQARGYTFIHAGVVGWRGCAILIPALSGAGKSTLVAELVQRGAHYYSDGWAVLDDAGHAHPFSRRIMLRAGARCAASDAAVPLRDLSPLPVALVVATTYRPGCVWEPLILQGARALLSVLDNAVLIREQPARILRLAGALGSSVVTLESPRPEADAVAPAILEFADALVAGRLKHFTSVRRQSATRPGARAIADARAPAADERLHRAPYLRIEEFLTPDEHRAMLEFARARERDFQESGVYVQNAAPRIDPNRRRSRSLNALDDRLSKMFEARLRALLPHVRQELGIPWFRLRSIEQQLHVHRGGDFYGRHIDNSVGDVAPRRVSGVYYFYEMPRRFGGGALYLYDEIERDGRREVGPSCVVIEPLDNSLVFFPSGVAHEIERVRLRDGAFGASRFTVTFWFREDETCRQWRFE